MTTHINPWIIAPPLYIFFTSQTAKTLLTPTDDKTSVMQWVFITVLSGVQGNLVIHACKLESQLMRSVVIHVLPCATLSITYHASGASNVSDTIFSTVEESGVLRLSSWVYNTQRHALHINVQLRGSHAHAAITHISTGRNYAQLDYTISIDHSGKGSTSTVDGAAVIAHHARATLLPKVTIHRPAQNSNATQSVAGLLLDTTARIVTRPALQVQANQVQCRHGATVSTLDAQMLWYLRSRGLNENKAREILIQAFISGMVKRAGLCMDKHIDTELLVHALKQSLL